MTDLGRFYSEVRALVDGELNTLIPAPGRDPARLYEAIRWSIFGDGKRFRPALVFAAGSEFGASYDQLLKTAAAVEMIHTYSLIHDDLPAMDDDDLRRGRSTAHKKFDEATAILAGDALQAMAFETIAEDDSLIVELRLRLIGELSVAAGQMVAGQQLDLEAEGKSLHVSDIERIHQGKTGALIRFAVRAGGLIARTSGEEFEVLTAFGEKLGLLFQITDDILDVTSTSEELGKTAGKDIASQKATYPEVLGLHSSKQLVKQVEADALSTLSKLNRADALLGDVCRYVSSRTN